MSIRLALATFAVLIGLGAAHADENHPEGMHVHGAYARVTQSSGAVYFTIHNNTAVDDAIITAETDAAAKTMLHSQVEDANGVMQMRALKDGLPLPYGEMTELARGGNHIMLMGLAKPLVDGDVIKVTLTFAKAAPMVIDVPVDNARTPDAAGEMDHEGMDHGSMDHDMDGD